MSQQTLERLLAAACRIPTVNGVLTVPVRLSLSTATSHAQRLTWFPNWTWVSMFAVVMDPARLRAMGNAVARSSGDAPAGQLPSSWRCTSSRHGGGAPSDGTECGRADGLIAVGSGSINDITKHAAHLTRKPYAVFGTAPSMNGYTSVNAAITEDGLKKSLASTAPRGVFLDLAVLAAAPEETDRGGFGDSICRATAQTDWLLSHLLLATPLSRGTIRPARRGRSGAGRERGWIDARRSQRNRASRSHARHVGVRHDHLRRDLIPPAKASISLPTTWTCSGPTCRRPLHGEHIAVTTMSVARLQEHILGLQSLRLRPQ